MPYILSDPTTFVDDALEGFARTYADDIRRVDGGVVRAAALPNGHVALVIGGGSGHYPAFAGTVGEGLAAGAVCGLVFTAPSGGAAYRVATAADAGGGVIFSFGNYAGDVMHFGEAQERLRDEGVDCRTVLVTDDVASAPVNQRDRRRGIAGDFVVFKIAGALAAQGANIDAVEAVALKANAATVTMGVAFGGCTVPGADAPLFTVPEAMMSVGLGIHGEPGVRDEPLAQAQDLAALLIEPLIAERPSSHGGRVGVVVNGLGTVKYEELFVLMAHVSRQLDRQGLEIAVAECGELVTSLDMAGVSLTITWLDPELEALWLAPAYTPAYRRGVVAAGGVDRIASWAPPRKRGRRPAPSRARDSSLRSEPSEPLSEAHARANRFILVGIEAAHEVVCANVDRLGELDAIAGDGDHGTGMVRGLTAALTFARSRASDTQPSQLLAGAGDAWSEQAGGTSGALWGAALKAVGPFAERPLGETAYAAPAAAAALDVIQQRGKAKLGDKTMVDALGPFAFALASNADKPISEALSLAANAATRSAAATASLSPKLGRARPLAERSVGHPDPGATSFALIVTAIAAALTGASS
jgi:dihydroxyacetone kinase